MLQTNLATRPFYNVRAVQMAIGLLFVLVAVVTLFNVVQYARLTASERTVGGEAARAEAEANRLLVDAERIRAQIDPKELAAVSAAAHEANTIIDQRVFSWTSLLAALEQALPDDVRLRAVQPRLESNGTFVVAMKLDAREVEDLDAFLEALEQQGTFRNVLPREEQPTESGTIEAVVEGVYLPGRERSVASGGRR